ncbi:hypothetical protein [Streptomyces sp. NRRL F-2747]|uniref:hypothetical protein n=1 Tax=Streptomyces sp. NRRL F-2747 TaxID=1463843 RepID=UPI00068D46A4|nr:hypothetical protein [Streptomyces sp. NRRL F-2747]
MQEKKRKAAVRAVQEATGLRYTAALRLEAAYRPASRPSFPFSALLAECATEPAASVDWGEDVFVDYVPEVFESDVVGGAIPYSCVLALAGALSEYGPNNELRVEYLDPLEEAVVASRRRRFRMRVLTGGVEELCRKPGCHERPVLDSVVEYCEYHLARSSAQALTSIAMTLGADLCSVVGDILERRGGSPEADILIRAAVARGAFSPVRDAFVHALYMNPSDIDDMFMEESAAMNMRHAIEREELRLLAVARSEYRSIRNFAGACATCGQDLRWRLFDFQVPPQYCTAACARSAPTADQTPDPWEVEECPF